MTRTTRRVRPVSRPRVSHVRRLGGVYAVAAVLAHAPATGAAAQTGPSPTTYEHVYPYNTPDLTENHYIVLDTSGAEPRGWYYGTSDEFDQAREGYLPGFFVAPMEDLELSASTIAFTLIRPERFFAAPVPLEYRSADAVPAGLLGEWTVRLPTESRRYDGALSSDRITLDIPGGPRVFRRR